MVAAGVVLFFMLLLIMVTLHDKYDVKDNEGYWCVDVSKDEEERTMTRETKMELLYFCEGFAIAMTGFAVVMALCYYLGIFAIVSSQTTTNGSALEEVDALEQRVDRMWVKVECDVSELSEEEKRTDVTVSMFDEYGNIVDRYSCNIDEEVIAATSEDGVTIEATGCVTGTNVNQFENITWDPEPNQPFRFDTLNICDDGEYKIIYRGKTWIVKNGEIRLSDEGNEP